MEVILIENIEKLGKVGDVIKVKDGYARNYLIPKKKVLRASKDNLKVFQEKKSVIEAEEKKRKEKSEETAKKIKNLEIIILRNAAENDQLYGSVTSKDIIKEIFQINKIQFLNEQINLKKTLKSIGVYEVEISVYTELRVKILVSVAKTKEAGLEQIKEFKNPKKIIKKEIKIDEKEKAKKGSDLNTKDLIQEIEKKDTEEKTTETKDTKGKTTEKNKSKEKTIKKKEIKSKSPQNKEKKMQKKSNEKKIKEKVAKKKK